MLAPLTSLPSLEQRSALEACIADAPQIDFHTENVIFAGMIARTIYIPKGATLVGTILRKDNINIVVGDITVSTDNGMLRFTGHHVIPAKAGSKRVGYAHSDTVWTTLSRTDLTDLTAIEDEMVESPETLQTRKLALLSQSSHFLGE